MIERKLDLELNDSSAILLSLLNFTTAFFIALVSFSQDVETHALSKPIIRIWRQQKCNRMKLLVQGWSESTCKLYDFVLTEIGDNESEILRRFKSGYFHPAKVIFVDAESSGLGTRQEFPRREAGPVSFGENYREYRALASGDEVNELAVAAWN
jgi:hypothetical protein